jgi:hypothetical protein
VRAAASPLLALTIAASLFAAPALAADKRTENAAQQALKDAAADYLSMAYDKGAARLDKALKACGANKCEAATKAALTRDLGTMQFRQGNKGAANKSFAAAARLSPGIDLNPDYDAPDLRSAWQAATGGGGGGSAGPQPKGDFAHTPAAEQQVDTPVPIYVEGGGDTIARVVVKYKGAGMTSWKRIELKRLDAGWGGLIPCADVQSGTLRYYVQGLDADGTPIATNGDVKHPYSVVIKEAISGEAPHLPGKSAPKSCSGSTDCPPDFPGCSKSGASDDEGEPKEKSEGPSEGAGEDKGKPSEGAGAFKRFWVGLGGTIDFMSLPAGDNLCHLDSNALPGNSANMYCTKLSGDDFPSHTDGGAQNSALVKGQAGHSNGGITPGVVRIFASVEYAITANILAGVRGGGVFFKYPGQAAVNDGRAFGSRLYLEARATYAFGDAPLARAGFAPIVFVGGGVSEFDAHTSSTAQLQDPNTGDISSGTVNIWQTNGPGFALVGGGVRYAFTPGAALTGAARVNLSFGGNGLIPTFGPELGVQIGL